MDWTRIYNFCAWSYMMRFFHWDSLNIGRRQQYAILYQQCNNSRTKMSISIAFTLIYSVFNLIFSYSLLSFYVERKINSEIVTSHFVGNFVNEKKARRNTTKENSKKTWGIIKDLLHCVCFFLFTAGENVLKCKVLYWRCSFKDDSDYEFFAFLLLLTIQKSSQK